MQFYCIRHGESEANRARIKGIMDTPLTERGREQAKVFAKQMQHESCPFSSIISSPQDRAEETARIISRMLNLPLDRHDGLRPRTVGKWTGCSEDEYKNLVVATGYRDRPPDGESLQDLENRLVPALTYLADQHEPGSLLLVTHSGILKVLRKICEGLPEADVKLLEFQKCSLYSFTWKAT